MKFRCISLVFSASMVFIFRSSLWWSPCFAHAATIVVFCVLHIPNFQACPLFMGSFWLLFSLFASVLFSLCFHISVCFIEVFLHNTVSTYLLNCTGKVVDHYSGNLLFSGMILFLSGNQVFHCTAHIIVRYLLFLLPHRAWLKPYLPS